MSRFHSHIASATKIINTYSAGKPLAIHIRSFFAADKKFGSKDRRAIASLCYYYFRTGNAFKKETIEEKILAGLFLCEHKSNELLLQLRPELDEKIGLSTDEKISLLNIKREDIFPFDGALSDMIELYPFIDSFFKQPQIYLRIRPGKKRAVIDKLNHATVPFELLPGECIKLGTNIAADKILNLNKDAVVQDLNSQKVLNYLEKVPEFLSSTQKITAWDACAASGGKSILLYDTLKGNVQLTVSDIRENILANLGKRLQQAGINLNRSFIADLSIASTLPVDEKFAVILCDAPCTGSGTWGRSPEQLYDFDQKMIGSYAEKQQKIVSNTIPHLKNSGLFFYITCSVFKKENEDMVAFIKEKFHLQLLQMEYLKGYETTADTMFVAVFSKTNP